MLWKNQATLVETKITWHFSGQETNCMWRKLTWRFFGRFGSFAVVYTIVLLIFVADSCCEGIATLFMQPSKLPETLLAKKPSATEDICCDNFLGDEGFIWDWKALSQGSHSINIRILRKMAQEKINASNKSTALLNFLGIHYQSAFHKDFKVAIIAESVTNTQPKTQLINCLLRKAYFDSDSRFTSKQLSVEIPYLEQLISSVIRHFNLLPYTLVSQFRIVTEVDAWSYVGVAERVKLNFYKIPLIKKDELWRKKRKDWLLLITFP